jgi:hypothetical protein
MGRNDLDLRRKANEKAKARAAHATLPSLLAVRIARSMPSADIGKQGIANWARTAAFDTRRPNQQRPLLPKRRPVKPKLNKKPPVRDRKERLRKPKPLYLPHLPFFVS